MKKHRGSLRYLIGEGFRNLRANRLMSVASVAVLVACLVMIGTAFLIFVNVDATIDRIGEQNIIMVYVEDTPSDLSREDYLKSVKAQVDALANVAESVLVTREEGYSDVLEDLGTNSSVLEQTDASFLPDGFRVTVKDMSLFAETVEQISGIPNVIHVRQNSDLADKLQSMSQGITYICLGIIALLFLVSLFIIANTIRITMHARRLEISIMKAVGATNWFIRTPFLVEGIVLGVISAIVSLGVLFLLYYFAGSAIQSLINILDSELVPFITYLPILLVGFLLISVVTGSLGSVFSIGKYLKEQGGVILDEDK